ncbi:hypothetical protein [Sphingomonas sp. NFR15]|uniref:hypothetical protein n=1 Tax=Sphingomonas sp. NFR15 TaxID=1566282 RepID=UPI00088C3D92|nr:hypothetical protein [Sphingomonas sp. NFR15]SDA15151.1 hypothetical protein SAMN03159340_00649 [Sphingomonas sp. NFR15]
MAPSGQRKKFCCTAHRGAFHEGCRRLGERMFAEGAVTLAQLRMEHGGDAVDGSRGAGTTPAEGEGHE